jgi:hypothetical protein
VSRLIPITVSTEADAPTVTVTEPHRKLETLAMS